MARTQRTRQGYHEIRTLIQTAVTAFGENSPRQKQERIERALTDFSFFARMYFPHHLTEKPSPMHDHLYETFGRLVLRAESTGAGARQVQAAPRGHAKSTLTTLLLPLWCIAFKHRRFIGVISDTTEQAQEFLESIKAELEVNERLLGQTQTSQRSPVWEQAARSCDPGRS